MYLAELKLWNYRKYGHTDWDLDKPHLTVPFNKGLNVLIGENDSGKTAILDAIKIVLKTHAYEWIKIEESDFHDESIKLRIELIFKGFRVEEAKNFTEWLGWEGEGDKAEPILRLIYEVERNGRRIFPTDVCAGMDDSGYPLNAEAREYLKCTYLKALRDADSELVAKKNSRVSQILQGHDLFKEKDGMPHDFNAWFADINKNIEDWFKKEDNNQEGKSNKEQIKDIIDKFLRAFIDETCNSKFDVSKAEIKAILEKLSLGIENAKNPGLGTMNRLFMAIELLHLAKQWDGLKLCLIEELEAHLHPQAQMKVIVALSKETDIQFILTTHSPNLASKVNIDNLIICNGNDAFPLRKEDTLLENKNYKYLKRFLDVTKSNLFFAKGVIIVEGWAEEILIPTIADALGYNLTKHEVSIVNVGSTAYLHFAKIFLRNDSRALNIPVSVVTDIDVRPDKDGNFKVEDENTIRNGIRNNFNSFDETSVKLFLAKQWTLEWCLFKSNSLTSCFKEAVSSVHSGTNEFKKDEDEKFKPEFETKLISKLDKSSSILDKVAVANNLAELIFEKKIEIQQNDEYIEYLVEAIKHACRVAE